MIGCDLLASYRQCYRFRLIGELPLGTLVSAIEIDRRPFMGVVARLLDLRGDFIDDLPPLTASAILTIPPDAITEYEYGKVYAYSLLAQTLFYQLRGEERIECVYKIAMLSRAEEFLREQYTQRFFERAEQRIVF